MDEDEKIKESRNIGLGDLARKRKYHVQGCIDYKHNSYRVQFFTKGNKLIMPVQIAEEEIEESKPKENVIPDKLKTLLKNLESYS